MTDMKKEESEMDLYEGPTFSGSIVLGEADNPILPDPPNRPDLSELRGGPNNPYDQNLSKWIVGRKYATALWR